MYRIIIAAIIASLAVPALAQDKSEANKAEEQKKKESDEIDRAYKNMVKKRLTDNLPRKQSDGTRGEAYDAEQRAFYYD
jgi:hypothetical protein